MRKLLVALAAVTVAMAVLASASFASTPKLSGTVGPGFTITLTQGGKKVSKLKAGTYTFAINDKSSIHSFGLDGPKGFAQGRQVQVLLHAARVHDVRQLHRLVDHHCGRCKLLRSPRGHERAGGGHAKRRTPAPARRTDWPNSPCVQRS
jgi:hypothetical protein